MIHCRHQIWLVIIPVIISSCSGSNENSVEVDLHDEVIIDTTTETQIDSSIFYEFFKKDNSDLKRLELNGFVKSVVHYTNQPRQTHYFFDSLGMIVERKVNYDNSYEPREADSLIFEYNQYDLPTHQTAYYSAKGDYKDGDKCCHQEHFYRLSDSTEIIKYYGAYGALLETEIFRYGPSKEILEREKINMNRDVYRQYYKYNPEGFPIESINVDGNFGDTLSITYFSYELDKNGNWIKKTVEHLGDKVIYKRRIQYF